MALQDEARNWTENDIAIVGMAAHFPGADTLAQYWENLRDGVESITRLSEEDLLEAGESLANLKHKDYVPAASILEGFEDFDAEFFGLSPKEAAIMDPQHRQFLEVSWEALESAGHMPEDFDGPIGVFGGSGMGSYFYFNLCSNRDLVDDTGMFLLRHTGNDKDFLTTRLSHILDLKGPSLNVQTACSTSLVAAHYAIQSLLNGECDMALAGGVTIEMPHRRGYVFKENEILSPDGHCHAFDARAQGTVFGSGAGVVVLRRMSDALADGDHIWAVIRGSAVNNDGADKAGYLAPSVGGQAAAIAEAQAMADVTADSIDYVECHGTGTYLGDPIEVTALTEAFREPTEESGFCKIGSVKTNIGHLDTAAGAASLIKTSLALHNKQIPPSLGYETPNPAIDFAASPFAVSAALSDWTSHRGPRRAGVNSLGVGGTNAHLILEEAPARAPSEDSDWPFQLLVVSGRTNKALEANSAALAAHLRAHPEQPLADVAYTLKEGRRAFEKRRIVVARSHEEAAQLLEEKTPRRVFTHAAEMAAPDTVFMFPGGGAQYVTMGRDLYETEPVFQEWMDRGLEILQAQVSHDVRALWLGERMEPAHAAAQLEKPSMQLPLIMIAEYALAQLWMSWGVQPAALVGHSMGENTAACLAGVMSFEDCIGLVLLRGRLFDRVPAGGMLSVPLPRAEVEAMLGEELDIAGVNAAELTVVSGPQRALDELAETLAAQEVEAQRIPINIAAHSRMLTPILEEFRTYLRKIDLNAPQIPVISNRSGKPLTISEATDPDYWVAHLRGTVHFADCLSHLAETKGRVYLEVGPGKALSALARMHPDIAQDKVLSSLRHPQEEIEDDLYFVGVLGQLWACGVDFDWPQLWGEARRNRVLLPSYAFQRSRYFIEPSRAQIEEAAPLLRQEDMRDWGYRPHWRPRLAECEFDPSEELHLAPKQCWLIFMDEAGTGAALAEKLRGADHRVVEVRAGDAFAQTGADTYTLAPERGREGFDQLLATLIAQGCAPDRILHLWLLTEGENFRPGSSFFHRNMEQGFHALTSLGQAIQSENLPRPLHLTVVSNGAAQVKREGLAYPEKATLRGPLGVMPREIAGMSCASLDLDWTPPRKGRGLRAARGQLVERLLEELLAPPRDYEAAWRGDKRYELSYRAAPLAATEEVPAWVEGGTYLITGGFGGIGLQLAETMLREARANVVLLTREALPAREDWPRLRRQKAPGDKLIKRLDAVERLESLGGTLMLAAADVCNIDQMRAAVAAATERFGRINGVVHAAGLIKDAPMLGKPPADIEDVLAPKLHGTRVLDALFPDGTLDWLVLFASTSTVTAPLGQVDYVAANAYLNAYAQARAQDKTRVVALNWGIWADVGMAADAMTQRLGKQVRPAPQPMKAPLMAQTQVQPDGSHHFMVTLDARRHWVLDQHRTKSGAAVLPGTGYLELISEAVAHLEGPRGFALRDLVFLRPVHVPDGQTGALRLVLTPSDAGYDVSLQGLYAGAGQRGFVVHAEGQVALAPLERPAPLDLAALRAACGVAEEAAPGQMLVSDQEAHLNFGAHWRVLRSRAFGAGEGVADLHLPLPLQTELPADMALHPGLLDLGTGWAMRLIDGYTAAHLWVPMSYGALRVHAPLPATLVSHVRLADGTSESGVARFDVTLADPEGNICVEVDGLTIKRLDGASSLEAAPAPRAHELLPEVVTETVQPLSAAEQRLEQNLREGIPAEEGPEAFRRALAAGLPQIIVSSLDLEGLRQQVAESEQQSDSAAQSFERPDLDTDFVAPESDVERTLAGFWQELLGVEQVGVEDSFFDLGGHSLIAVRLFAKVKKTYQIEFPISVLFEAPSIASIAKLIEAQIGRNVGDDGGAAPLTQALPRRYTHLVPMGDTQAGSKAPFFLVAGMYGNVLNLRHLAHLIGADRPFYGLQAKGLFGDDAPHDDLSQAAADYIAEMRQVQPYGPYMIGGFSGGGITAFEIAQQLKAAGEEVALLVMLDTPLPQRRPLSRGDRVWIQWHELRKGGLAYPLRWLRNRIAWEIHKRRAPDVTEEQGAQFHNAEIETAFLTALTRYQVAPWTGSVALFRPPLQGHWAVGGGRWVDNERAYVFEDNDWGQWLSDLSVTEVPGDHDSMVLEPNVRVLAAHIKQAIEAAEAKHPPQPDHHRAAE